METSPLAQGARLRSSTMSDPMSTTGNPNRRRMLEARGRVLGEELGVDLDAFGVGSNLHWAMMLMKIHFERAPLRPVGLSLSEFVTLWSIRVGQDMEAGDVAAEVGVPPSSFTAVAQRLERRGLLVRRRHPLDGRFVIVSITEAGSALVETAFRLVNAEAIKMTSHLDREDVVHLAEQLRSVADQLSSLIDQGSPIAAPVADRA